MGTGLWIAVAAVVVALAFGTYRALTDGTFRGTRVVRPGTAVPDEAAISTEPEPGVAWAAVQAAIPSATRGERATLLQFSSAFCAPCRATRRILEDVAGHEDGVVHLEVDAEHHLALVRALDVLRTPTTLVLDGEGNEITRAAGAPRREQVLAALSRV